MRSHPIAQKMVLDTEGPTLPGKDGESLDVNDQQPELGEAIPYRGSPYGREMTLYRGELEILIVGGEGVPAGQGELYRLENGPAGWTYAYAGLVAEAGWFCPGCARRHPLEDELDSLRLTVEGQEEELELLRARLGEA
ncbi:MAG: hypothetical protein AB1941_01835 [Gemmatimonadota bacterium]